MELDDLARKVDALAEEVRELRHRLPVPQGAPGAETAEARLGRIDHYNRVQEALLERLTKTLGRLVPELEGSVELVAALRGFRELLASIREVQEQLSATIVPEAASLVADMRVARELAADTASNARDTRDVAQEVRDNLGIVDDGLDGAAKRGQALGMIIEGLCQDVAKARHRLTITPQQLVRRLQAPPPAKPAQAPPENGGAHGR